MRSAPVLSALVLLLTACTSDAPSDRNVLISLTDEVIVPAYQTFARDVAQLDQDVKALCDAPSDTSLEDARRSWRRARDSWMRSEAMWFGPVMERRSISLLDWSPTDAEGIDRLLAEARPITVDEVRDALASNQRGFGAIERILFSDGALADLSQSADYCSYLGALTAATRQEAGCHLVRMGGWNGPSTPVSGLLYRPGQLGAGLQRRVGPSSTDPGLSHPSHGGHAAGVGSGAPRRWP